MSAPSITLQRDIHNLDPASAGGTNGSVPADLDRLNLARFQLFSNADLNVLEPLLSSCAVVGLVRGDVLISANDPNNALYLVLDGRLRVQLDADADASINVIEAGDCVGELSLIDGKPASARVVADADTRVLAVDRDTFWAMIRASHSVACNLLMNISRRLRKGNTVVAENQ